jgi:flagellar hook-basal body complex protein FliE
MIKNVSQKPIDLGNLENDMRSLGGGSTPLGKLNSDGESSFLKMLKEGIQDVNQSVKASDKASADLASGKSSNLHETMLSVTKAELGFNLLVQLRNKAIDAYEEVMKMQV